MSTDLVSSSKFLSFVLRHRPEKIGIKLDKQGWTDINDLIDKSRAHGEPMTIEQIRQVVQENDKKRFQLSDDGLLIRAVQGHSTDTVAIKRKAARPPAVLYHGTAIRFVEAIEKMGLIPGKRHQVHLSNDLTVAADVGRRHTKGRVVIFEINTNALHAKGHRFEQAENGVWLTDSVPASALKRLS